MSYVHGQSRPRPRRATRAPATYHDFDSDTEADLPSPSRPTRPSRTNRRPGTYREDSDEDASDPAQDDSDSIPRSQHSPLRSQSMGPFRPGLALQHDHTTRVEKRKALIQHRPAQSHALRSFKRRKPGTRSDSASRLNSKIAAGHMICSGNIPPWQTLEYSILVKIMQQASCPLYESSSRPTPGITWLLETSTLCKAFHDACITTLLYSPPLFPSYRAHALLGLLSSNQESLSTNYQNKIKCLEVEVKNLLIRKSGINLEQLLHCTPLLQGLRLYHNHDDLVRAIIWAQPFTTKSKWAYPALLFDTMDGQSINLKTFEWNGRFPLPLDVLQMMNDTHLRPSLQKLEAISLLNFNVPEKASEGDEQAARSLLISALGKLPNLINIEFRNSSLVTAAVLPHLPIGMHLLSFNNCPAITSSAIEEYLTIGGGTVLVLNLIGNQAMDLGFFSKLKELVPNLQKLNVDLTYTDPTSYCDREPFYDALLPDGAPTWPTSLREVVLENLRNLSTSDAEGFFASLIAAAADLSYLRTLSIKAILKEASWRDRAEMRKKWKPLFERVFMCKSYIPSSSANCRKPDPVAKSRKSARIAKLELDDLSNSVEWSDSDPACQASAIAEIPIRRQGRCDIVDLVISDQRPAPEQYTERDFMDDEVSGDEEWTGVGSQADGYAW